MTMPENPVMASGKRVLRNQCTVVRAKVREEGEPARKLTGEPFWGKLPGDLVGACGFSSQAPQKMALTTYMNYRNCVPALARQQLGFALAACALWGVVATPVCAAEAKPAVDPHADELLTRMSDYLGQAQSFLVSAEIWQDVQLSSGQRVQAGRTVNLQVRRPPVAGRGPLDAAQSRADL